MSISNDHILPHPTAVTQQFHFSLIPAFHERLQAAYKEKSLEPKHDQKSWSEAGWHVADMYVVAAAAMQKTFFGSVKSNDVHY